MSRITNPLTGFAVGWLICLLEYLFTATAWGGPFTILMIPVAAAIVSAGSVLVAALVGLVLRLPLIRDVWRRAGYWAMCILHHPTIGDNNPEWYLNPRFMPPPEWIRRK